MEPSFLAAGGIDDVSEATRLFYRRSLRLVNRTMMRQGVSIARTRLLLFIERDGPVRSTDVVEAFGYSPRTVTEAIDALERDGLVTREPDPHDRRAKRISITPAGLAALQASEPSRRAFVSRVFDVLDADEAATFRHLLDKLNARLEMLECDDAFPPATNAPPSSRD